MQMILHCTKAKKSESKLTKEVVSFDRFNGPEVVELHKSMYEPQALNTTDIKGESKTGLGLNVEILTRSALAAQTVPTMGLRLKQSGSKFD